MTIDPRQMEDTNKDTYQNFYEAQKQAFLRYPADWVIRFHNMYLKEHLPSGRILDYGYGSGNNSIFLIPNGYDVDGVEVAESAPDLVKLNLEKNDLDASKYLDKYQVLPLPWDRLPFEDNTFDMVLCNQVLYYLASEEEIRRVCREFSRCLKPGGIVFFTMYGPTSYYIRYHTKQIHDRRIYEIDIDDPKHRLYGLHEMVYLVRDEEDLKDLFSDFECVTTGYFDQRMFDLDNFHWIFAGRKPR